MTDTQIPQSTVHTNGHASSNGHRPMSIDAARQRPRPQDPRVPPHNLDAERSLLGAMLLSRDAIEAATVHCGVDDLYKPAHAHIFAAIVDLHSRGEPADPVTVSDRLAKAGLLDAAGGLAELITIQAETPQSTNAAKYARIVEEHALFRRLIAIAGEIAEMGYHGGECQPALDQAEAMVFELTTARRSEVRHAESLSHATVGWLERLEDRYINGTQAISTGLVDLDNILAGGLRRDNLVAVGGRPGSGKSTLGVQIAFWIAAELALPGLVVSAEMATEEIVERLVSAEAKVDNQRLRAGRVGETEWPKISSALGRFNDVPLFIYDEPVATIMKIRAEIRRVIATAGHIGVVVVDYLQLLKAAGKAENRQVEVDQLTRELKELAREFNVPVVVLCQLNRNLELRADKRPLQSDFRESGGVENHSDIVIGVYRDEMYNTDSADRGTAELIVLKHRGGPLGTVNVAYLPYHGRFANMARV